MGAVTSVADVHGLTRSFGKFPPVHGFDLRVQAGEVHCFLGPNGSGESTTIRVLFGRLRADSGTVTPPTRERLFLRLYEAKERSCLLVPRRRGLAGHAVPAARLARGPAGAGMDALGESPWAGCCRRCQRAKIAGGRDFSAWCVAFLVVGKVR